ncbi:MAG: penicillin-binding protein activator LpoB [Alphaproteobacteria bacterium]|nr:penicillin-binding protein activator LpoB [Alphaproteobacteria bacterium]
MRIFVTLLLLAATAATPALAQRRGQGAVDVNPMAPGPVSGTGIEMRDIIAMSDTIVRDLMQRADITGTAVPPRIILEGARIRNQSSQRLDTDLFSDQLRSNLMRAAAGKLRFLSRESIQDVLDERDRKRQGQADVGTRGLTKAVAGGDYRLIGRITSQDARNNDNGMTQRATQVVFELVDMENAETVYISQPFVVVRAQRDDIVYR